MEGKQNDRQTDIESPSILYKKVAMITHCNTISNIPMKEKVLLEGFLLIIVVKGEIHITVEGVDYVLQAGDLFSCVPRNLLESPVTSENHEAHVIYLSPDFAEDLAKKVHIDWTLSMMTKRHEILHANADDINIILKYFELAKAKLDAPDSEFKVATLEMLFAAMSCELFDIRSKAGRQLPPIQQYSAADNLLQRFVKLRNESGHNIRSVNEYAASLCVSSKYFSSVCKQLTGKPASSLINEDIIRSAQLMLADNGKSLKQIADALNFKNQSHFGTFFRRHVGMSPQQYRDSSSKKH